MKNAARLMPGRGLSRPAGSLCMSGADAMGSVLRSVILILAAGFLVVQPGRLLAQSRFIPAFQHFGVEEGLAQSSAVCLAQDHDGFLWVGTYAGLNRFDGYSFKLFASDQNTPGSLADSNIRALMVDDEGALWVGTRNGGLSRYDSVSGSFANFRNDPSDPLSIPSDEVHAIHQDSRGVIRVGTASGMAELQKTTGVFRYVPQAPGDPKGNREIVSITEDGQGRIWAASRHMVFRLDMPGGVLTPAVDGKLADDLLQAEINQVFMEGRDVLWLACDVSGIFRVDLVTGRVERHLPATGVFKLLRDKQGTLWAATSGGVARLVEEGENRHFELFPHNSYNPGTISQNDVISLMEDDSGILWAGTYSGGLNKLIPGSRWFASYQHVPGDSGSLPGKEVSAICPGRDGSLWVGMRYAGLVRMDRSRRVVERFVHDPANPRSLAEDQINCVMEDSKGRIWVGTVESGISVLDRSTGSFTRFHHDPDDPGSLSQDKIWWLLEDKDGMVWAGTSKGGLNRINPVTGKAKRFVNDPRNPSSISHDRVRHVMQSRDGTIWVGTNAGLDRFDPATETFTHWRSDPKDPESLSNDRVTPIVEDSALLENPLVQAHAAVQRPRRDVRRLFHAPARPHGQTPGTGGNSCQPDRVPPDRNSGAGQDRGRTSRKPAELPGHLPVQPRGRGHFGAFGRAVPPGEQRLLHADGLLRRGRARTQRIGTRHVGEHVRAQGSG